MNVGMMTINVARMISLGMMTLSLELTTMSVGLTIITGQTFRWLI